MNRPTRDYLSPEVMGALSRLDLIAAGVVEGYLTGLHQSPYHGFSTEFADRRPYLPGDPLRFVDWKVYGRTDRLYLKRFEEETNLKAHIILDCSASMEYRESGSVSKFRYAGILAAALAYLMIRQRDGVGLVTFAETLTMSLPPRSLHSHLTELLGAIDAVHPSGGTKSGQVLHALAEGLKLRGLVILISDLIMDHDELIRGLRHFRHDGHDVLVLQVLDPMEVDFGFTGEVRFRDPETGQVVTTQPRHIRERYRALFNERQQKLTRALHDIAVDHSLITTNTPFDRALTDYLVKRKRLN